MHQDKLIPDVIDTCLKHRKSLGLKIINSIIIFIATAVIIAPAIIIIYDHDKVFLSIGSVLNYFSTEGLKDGVWSTALFVAVWSSFTGAAAAYFLSFIPWARDYKTQLLSNSEANAAAALTNIQNVSNDSHAKMAEKVDMISQLFAAHNNCIIHEHAVRQIEGHSIGLDFIYVVVNSLTYELDNSYGYCDIISNNIARGVRYLYILPDSDDCREEWNDLEGRISKYISDNKLAVSINDVFKAEFEAPSYTSLATPGLAIYTANQKSLHGTDMFAIKYLPEFGANIKLRCDEKFKDDRKAIRKIIAYIREKHGLPAQIHAAVL